MTTAVPSSLSALLKKSTLEDHGQLLAASEAALKQSKNDLVAQHVKVVALVKLDRYAEVVEFVEKTGSELQREAAVEYAYALYKIGKLEKAAELAATVENRIDAKHVEAQSRYRLEEWNTTAQIYGDIAKHKNQGEDFDIRVNQSAIDAQGQWLGLVDPKQARRAGREDLEAFETAYNAACGCIARGELSQAAILLKRAKELCKHSEDLSDDAKADELLPITVQQLYVAQRLGKESEAKSLTSEINLDAISDAATRKVAQSNILLSSASSNPFLTHKLFNQTPQIPSSERLFSYQAIPLGSNEKVLDLQSFKFEGIATSATKNLVSGSSASLSPHALSASALNAAARARNETGKLAVAKVRPELERRPNDAGLVITMVQLYMAAGNPTSAIETLESFLKRLDSSSTDVDKETRFHPTVISILMGLYKVQGRKADIKKELTQAALYWRQKPNAPTSLLLAAGRSLLESTKSEDVQEAADIFDKLRQQRPDEKAVTAGWVASRLAGADQNIQAEAEKLTSIANLTRNIDVDALENSGIPQSSNALAIAQRTRTRKRKASDGTSTKPKRIRPSRLPKDYDPNKTPDPERWLPLRDRSTYKPPKGKKKGRKAAGEDRTQGGAVNEDLDIESKPVSTNVASTGGGGSSKRKKGKGKK